MPKSKRWLRVYEFKEWRQDCDGCGKKIKIGEKCLTDIQSCCSSMPGAMGCVRTLCEQCVKWAYKELGKETMK